MIAIVDVNHVSAFTGSLEQTMTETLRHDPDVLILVISDDRRNLAQLTGAISSAHVIARRAQEIRPFTFLVVYGELECAPTQGISRNEWIR